MDCNRQIGTDFVLTEAIPSIAVNKRGTTGYIMEIHWVSMLY